VVTLANNFYPANLSPFLRLKFEGILPNVRQQAEQVFAAVDPVRRKAMVDEVVIHALDVLMHLAKRGKNDFVYPEALAMFGSQQIRNGLHVGKQRFE
jgi:hypothetical protein